MAMTGNFYMLKIATPSITGGPAENTIFGIKI